MATFMSKKKQIEIAKAEMARSVLNKHNKDYKGKKSKKLTYEEMLDTVRNINKVKDFWIRKPEDWVAKSFNTQRQTIDFVTHLLCGYSVPMFMYKIFLSRKEAFGNNMYCPFEETILDWFITMAQGMSFRKASKNYFSKKEAAMFLKAPKENTILGNMLWAKCKVHGAPPIVANSLAHYWADRVRKDNFGIWNKIIVFYAQYPEIDGTTLHDTLDFLNATFYRDKNFTLSGRTLNSVIELANGWHVMLNMQRGFGNISWEGLPIPDWKWEIDKNGDVWFISQILNGKRLIHEGRTMKHCVASYASRCQMGYVGIFSVEHMYYGARAKLLTVEVNSNNVITQARGKMNRWPTKEEFGVLRRWANNRGLRQSSYLF